MENMYNNIPKIDTTNTTINLLKINSGINKNTHKNRNGTKLFSVRIEILQID
jgi:hypothetical protein